jgi:hypothetical protein
VIPTTDRLVKMQSENWLSTVCNAIVLTVLFDKTGLLLATFQDAIMDAVPHIIELLKESNSNVGLAAVSALGKLAEHGM